ncbi:cobalt ECF transporter T component CbiQ [Zavarzinia compransoris]|uniref:cobalt ECF transporter T component CbiQ n=1 Tax=Zavarzinia compransoris TaxID=1264899 RepID=UPI0010D8AEB4|nr:cobalt ECF transporter T component CbiQ [Zavarzinia compransoris]TDP46306.1 cobalt/nickel transport system permease protein [Zavarzinia compransoris]
MTIALDSGKADRIDSRARLFAALVLLLAITSLRGLPAQAVAAGAGLLLVLAAGPPLAALARRLLHVEGFLVLLLLMLPLTVAGTPLVTLGPLALSEAGLLRALSIVLKVNAAVMVAYALLGGLDPLRIGHGARRLGLPLRFVQLFLFTTRYIEIYRGEIRRLREAMRARAFVPRTSLHSFRSFGNLAGMVLLRALDRASRVEEAMRCRAFDGRLPAIGPEEAGRGGPAAMALAVAAALALVTLDHWP